VARVPPEEFEEHVDNLIVDQYLETAIWTSTDESDESGGNPLDQVASIDDFTEEAREQARQDLRAFYFEMSKVLDALEHDDKLPPDLSGWPHDFWLTRNGHGAGFWDKPERYGDAADPLTELAHRAGECNVQLDWIEPTEEGEEAVPELSFYRRSRTRGNRPRERRSPRTTP
jgi:hypothetical protein